MGIIQYLEIFKITDCVRLDFTHNELIESQGAYFRFCYGPINDFSLNIICRMHVILPYYSLHVATCTYLCFHQEQIAQEKTIIIILNIT